MLAWCEVANPAPALSYSFRDYVAFEKSAHEKHEFVAGLILAMAGGTLEHSARCSNVIVALGTQLAGKRCRIFESNARIRILASGNAYYPDASIVCGTPEVDPEDGLSLTNPVVLVEVLSPSTEEYDRTDKLFDYQRIASLKHVVHVAHDEQQVAVFTRSDGAWVRRSYGPGESLELGALGCEIDVAAIYHDPLR
jgi:Uma2 family endonuclease